MKLYIYIATLFLSLFFSETIAASSIADLIPDGTETHKAVNDGSWFTPATWNTNTVPSAGAIVLIPADKEITYEGSSEAHIFAIKVIGKLTFTQTNSASITKLIVDTFVGTMSSKIYFHASDASDGKIDVIFKPFDIEQHKDAGTRIYPLVWNSAAETHFKDGINHYKVTYKLTTTDDKERFDTAAEGNANTTLTEYSNELIDDGPGVYGRSSWDAEQLSLGLATMGQIQVLGKVKTTKLKLSADAAKGQKTLQLVEAPSGWLAGDELVINSGGNIDTNSRGVDEREIGSVSGTSVQVTSNLSFNHEGKGAESLHCYVGNLSRNITFSSADISMTSRRGHIMAMHNPMDVQFRYARFKNLGRTDKSRVADDFIYDQWIEPVVFTSKLSALGLECMQLKKADATKITNSRGRYSIHLHRTGAANGTQAAYVEGNVVWGNPGWGITHHDSHAEITNNIVYEVAGAGIVSEAGNETGFWDDNFLVKITKARSGIGDAFTPVEGENYFDPDFYHSALFYDDYLFRGEALALRGRAVVCRNNIISDSNFGVGVTNINPVKTNLLRVDPEALKALRPTHQVDHFPLDVEGYSKEGDGVMPIEVALIVENTVVVNSYNALNSIERDMGLNHESRSVFDGFKSWGCNIGLQLTYQADYSFKDVYISGKNSNSRGMDMWKHSSNHSFENIKIEDCATAIRVSKVVGLGTDYTQLKTRNNGFTQWSFINYSESNVTEHYELELDTDGATYSYDEHTDNIVYLSTADVMDDRDIAFTLTDEADLEVDVAANDFRFEVDGYISDCIGSYNYGVKSAWAQGNLRFDYPQRIYEFASKAKFEAYLVENNVYKDAANGNQLYFIVNESVPDRLSFEYKSFPIRINILNAPATAPYSNAIYETEMELAPKAQLVSLKGVATQSTTSTAESYKGLTIETPASRAIDGNTNGRLHAQYFQKGLVPVGSSSYTEEESEPWWDLDLGKDYNIESIEVWGTQNLNGSAIATVDSKFKNFYVLIDDEPFGDVDLATAKTNALVYFYRGETGSRLYSKTGITAKGRYVRIQAEGTTQLALAEVSVLGREDGKRYCDFIEENGTVINGDFECGHNTNWEFVTGGNAVASFTDGTTESFDGSVSAKIDVTTGDAYNKAVLKNKVYGGNLKDKDVKFTVQAKSPDAGTSFRFQIQVMNGEGVTTNLTSPVMNLTANYQEFEYPVSFAEDTQQVVVKINAGKTVGTYYFDDVSGIIEDSLSVDEVHNEPFVFYPNPSNGMITLKNYKSISQITVVSVSGQLLKRISVNSEKIDLTDLQSGMYVLMVTNIEGHQSTSKIIINN
ncbi:T9SS type A sorting domain-containing protein [Flavicella marina]|uniref:T9SS type A sorting domain-containing protein n=1 Tax=Flavicella marina TaxID=1475951 RepID=UPI0012651D2C|nr:T9SS type A sorting domain-containing protein [Flavicella marina]